MAGLRFAGLAPVLALCSSLVGTATADSLADIDHVVLFMQGKWVLQSWIYEEYLLS